MSTFGYITGENTIKCHQCGAFASPDLSRFNTTLRKFVCMGCDEKLKKQEEKK